MNNVKPIRGQSQGLSRDVIWMVAGNAFYVGCQWGVLVATVKCGTAEMVGQLSLGFAICAPIFLFCQLRLRAASATDSGCEYEASEYLALRLFCTSIALLGVLLICIPGHFAMQTTLTILGVAVAKAIESGSDLFYGFLFVKSRKKIRFAGFRHFIACKTIFHEKSHGKIGAIANTFARQRGWNIKRD